MDNFECTNLVRWPAIMKAWQTINLGDQILEGWPCQDLRDIVKPENRIIHV